MIDSLSFIHVQLAQRKRVLIEGANALMLDLDFGTYPFVTSSSTTIGGVLTGLGIPPKAIGDTIGVVKAYTTRVGGGPFPTEQLNDIGRLLQDVGREVGTTTGRPRRCGWLDLVVMRHSCLINGYTSLNLTKLDILDALPEIKVAVAYRMPMSEGGSELQGFPADLDVLEKVQVQYESLPGWQTSIAETRKYEELPENCRKYVEFIEKFLGVPVQFIGVGPGRESMITKPVN